ncbi:ABC transporter ATP-binding protein [Thermoclostridium caenicola]|uniref:ABC-2 type transport system ATP-binding protein n=1 Tax=Thermoclostridium caenicola TaxID=659425 RepID=A0A1M6IBI6_9FIRM|nr:ATP-binding cassette domain-containing protein [Thermoclostridium caenicola]SHJ31842.1 ABC-2 type transport system ATP-binding protein [Thermoclostridium caenicola]
MAIIQARSLTKIYRRIKKQDGLKGAFKALFHREVVKKAALDSFDLEIDEGECIGLIGPNGAGKTTLVKLLCGIIQPTSGSCDVLGFTPGMLKNEFRRSFAVVMGQKSQLWWDLPASDTFALNREIYDIPEEVYRANMDYFSDLFQVKDLINVPVRNLSLGERMKMELIAALLHSPRVLFLDEPTIGLDAIAQKQIRQFLRQVNQERGVTILLTSHYMEDIRHLCKRTVVISSGKKIYDGPLDMLLDRFQEYRVIHVTFERETEPQLDAVEWVEKSPYKAVFRIRRDLVTPTLQEMLSLYDVDDIRIEEEDIGNVIERIYHGENGGDSCGQVS